MNGHDMALAARCIGIALAFLAAMTPNFFI